MRKAKLSTRDKVHKVQRYKDFFVAETDTSVLFHDDLDSEIPPTTRIARAIPVAFAYRVRRNRA